MTLRELTAKVPWYVKALAAAALVAGVFVAGRFSAPLQVEERVEIRESDELRAKYDAAISESNTWRQLVEKKTKTIKIPIPIACDGGVPLIAYREEQEQEEKARGEGSGKRQETASGENEAKASREAIQQKTVTLRPNWRVTPLVGLQIKTDPSVTVRPMVGAGVEHRIYGGLSGGVLVLLPPTKIDEVIVTGSASFEF